MAEVFDLARVIGAAESIKGARQAQESDLIRRQYMQRQDERAQQQSDLQAKEYENMVDERTAKQHYLVADAVLRAPDKMAAIQQLAPEFIAEFDKTNVAGAFQGLSPEQVSQMATVIRDKSAARAGIQAPVQVQTVDGPRGAVLQRDPRTGAMTQVVGPDNSQPAPPSPSYQHVQLEDGTIGAFDMRTGKVIPTDARGKPTGKTDPAFRDTMALRKEFDALPTVKDYRQVQTLYQRAATAPNTRAGDLSLVYALGKIFDPGSVVREGELQLSANAAPWLQKITGHANSQISGKGALQPGVRAELLAAMKGQVDSIGQQYNQARQQYAGYATQYGAKPEDVVGSDPTDVATPSAPPAAITATGPNGQKLQLVNGKWEPMGG